MSDSGKPIVRPGDSVTGGGWRPATGDKGGHKPAVQEANPEPPAPPSGGAGVPAPTTEAGED